MALATVKITAVQGLIQYDFKPSVGRIIHTMLCDQARELFINKEEINISIDNQAHEIQIDNDKVNIQLETKVREVLIEYDNR